MKMTKTQKANFRMSSTWKTFRAKMKKKANCFDWLTKKPLSKTWNLHHLDMRSEHYKDISDPERFMPLNEDTHEFVHWFYKYWVKDQGILSRLSMLCIEMFRKTHDKQEEINGTED